MSAEPEVQESTQVPAAEPEEPEPPEGQKPEEPAPATKGSTFTLTFFTRGTLSRAPGGQPLRVAGAGSSG